MVLLTSLFFMRIPLQSERENRPPHLFRDISEGLRWVWRQPTIRFLIVLSGYLELIVSINVVLLTVIAHDERLSLRFIGIILAMAGAGSLLGAVLCPVLQRYLSVGRFLMNTLPLMVLLWPLYAFVRNPWVLGTVVASLALLGSLTYIQTVTYLLAVVPNSLQGRVNSIARLFFSHASHLARLASALVSAMWGCSSRWVFYGQAFSPLRSWPFFIPRSGKHRYRKSNEKFVYKGSDFNTFRRRSYSFFLSYLARYERKKAPDLSSKSCIYV